MAAQAADLQKTHMKAKCYGDEVIKCFNNMRKNDEFCDFTVSAEGRSIKTHKVLLAATSDYFQAMLQGPMRENIESCVDLKGIAWEALEQIIEFIYSGSMDLNFDTLIEVLNAASHLQVRAALGLCADYMIQLLTFKNATELLSIADTYSLDHVLEYYNNKVLDNFEEFSSSEKFLNLSGPELTGYLTDDGLRIKSEYFLYDVVSRWCDHDRSRLENIESVLKYIRFSLMSGAQLNNIRQHWLTRNCVNTLGFVLEGKSFHHELTSRQPQLGSRAKIRAKDQSLTFITQGSSYRPFEITAYNHKTSSYYQLFSDISCSRDCRIASLNNFIYVSGVVDSGGGTLMNSLLRFDPRHLAIQELMPCRRLRIDPSLTSMDNHLYLFGGTDENLVILDYVECYDVLTNRWVELSSLPHPCHSLSTVVVNNLIYVSGGVSVDRQPIASMYCFNPSIQVWEVKNSMYFARRLHEMAYLNSEIYVLGGIGDPTYHNQTQIPIEVYNFTSNQWTILSTTLAGRSVGHFLILNSKIISVGREHYEATEEDIREYDRESDKWTVFSKIPRRGALASTYSTLMYLNFFDEKISKRVITDKR